MTKCEITGCMDIAECLMLGANSFISKPVAFDEFVKVVGDLGMYWLHFNKSIGE